MANYFQDDRPTAESMSVALSHWQDVWRKTEEKNKKADTFYNLRFQVWKSPTDKRRIFYPPHARALIDGAVDTMLSVDPRVKRLPVGTGAEAERKANKGIEPGLQAVLVDSGLKEAILPWRQAGHNLYLYGRGVLGAVYDDAPLPKPKRKNKEAESDYKDRVAKWEAHRSGWNPIRITAPHPSRVFMNPRDMDPQECLLTGTRYARDLYALTKDKARFAGKWARAYDVESNPYRPVEVVERWTPGWHALQEKDGEMLFVEPNSFGVQPFRHAWSGLGSEETDEDFDPSQYAVGLLESLYDTLTAQALDKSGKLNALIETAYARPGTSLPVNEAAQQLEAKMLEGKKEDWWWHEYPALQQWMMQMGEVLERDYIIGSYPRSAVGERQVGVATVGQEMLLQQAVDRKFYIVGKRMEQLASLCGETILRYVDISGEAIHLRGDSLKPTDIDDVYEVSVTFPLLNPAIVAEEKRNGLAEVAAGVISAKTWRERYGRVENEDDEWERLQKERMERMPEVEAEIMDSALREEGFVKLADRLKQRRDLMRQQARMGQQGMSQGQPQGQPGGM